MKSKLIEEKLKKIYGKKYQKSYLYSMVSMLCNYKVVNNVPKPNHKTAYMITYGDSFYNEDEKTFEVLHRFTKNNFGQNITDIHILPMFEYTSDDGFSVVDYMKIHESLGTWHDLKKLSKDYNLMYDFVANHISQKSDWFLGYLNNEEKYKDFFIDYNEGFDYSKVVRPRTSDLISKYENNKRAWTTFSSDQVDLNYENIDVLVETTQILFEYIKRGATSIRLDAIGFLWKESGTSCIHLEQAHEVVKLWRYLINSYAPNVQIITETNVPHKENISYFGDNDEAHQVYQFALPPLTLHTFLSSSSKEITNWAKGINKVSDNATYFNFLASHDGIGMRPVEGILTTDQLEVIFNQVKVNGGKFNMKTNTDGTESVYEMNITYFDALKTNEDLSINIDRFIAAHGILLSLIGIPAIYYNSLIGSTNDYDGVLESGISRRINREKFDEARISDELLTNPRRKEIVRRFNELLSIRQNEILFDPYIEQEVIDISSDVFALRRYKDNESIICIINVTNKAINLNTDITGFDIITKKEFTNSLNPYQIMWIK